MHDPECDSLLISDRLVTAKFLVADLGSLKDKVAMWVKLRYLFETLEVIPMDKDPYSWAGKAHDYAGWTVGGTPRANAIVTTGSFTARDKSRFPLLGFVEYVAGDKMCVSRWDPVAKKLQLALLDVAAADLAIYKK